MNIALKENYLKKEIINGNIYYMSPARYEHTRIVKIIYDKLIKYLDNKTCEVFQDNLYVILDENNKFIPDVTVVCDKSKFTTKGYEGTPKLIIEVLSVSTMKQDRFLKKDAYEKFGVLEYIIIDTKNNLIEQYTLKDGKYVGNVFILFKKDDLENLTENEKNLYTDIFKSTSLENFEMNLNEIFY